MSDRPSAAVAPPPAGTIHSARYQRRRGPLRAASWTWPAMVVHGVRLAFKERRTLLLMMPSLGFVVAAASVFYVLALLERLVGTDEARGIQRFVQTLMRVDLSQVTRIGEYRLQLWAGVFIVMIKVQSFYLLIVIGQVGPGLIANDLKTNALPIYFARPITPLTYLLGKWLTIAVFIALAMLLPNLLALATGILFAGPPGSWSQTLGLAWHLALVGVGVMIVGGLLILAVSSLTADKRLVIVGWLALALLPHIAQQALYEQMDPERTERLLGSLSLSDDVVILTTWLFDLRQAWQATGLPSQAYSAALGPTVEPLYPALVLLGAAALAATVCYRRVVRFSQAAANV
jgi:hypothetical protein